MGWVRGEPWCCPSWGAMGWGWGQRGGTLGGRSQSGFPHEVLSRCGAIRCSPKGATFLGICGAGLGAVGQCQGRGRRGEQGGAPTLPPAPARAPRAPQLHLPLVALLPGGCFSEGAAGSRTEPPFTGSAAKAASPGWPRGNTACLVQQGPAGGAEGCRGAVGGGRVSGAVLPPSPCRPGAFLVGMGPAGCSPRHGSFSSGKMKAGGAAEIRGMSLGVGEIRS